MSQHPTVNFTNLPTIMCDPKEHERSGYCRSCEAEYYHQKRTNPQGAQK